MSKKTITVTPPKRTPTLSECQDRIEKLKSLLNINAQINEGTLIFDLPERSKMQLRREIEAVEDIIANGEYKDA